MAETTTVEKTNQAPSALLDATGRIVKTARVGVLCGGLSSERAVSLRSGKNCYEALQRLGYENVFLLDVQRDIVRQLESSAIEVAFLALHGQYGEDGCIQGLLEWLNIPYTGNGVLASAVTMDKDLTKRLLKEAGLPVIPSITLQTQPHRAENSTGSVEFTEPLTDICQRIMAEIGLPVMVKPASEGSSVGMNKVSNADALADALRQAGQYSRKILVEAFRSGKSLTVGVLERNGQLEITPILELRTQTEWYDFEAKYTQGLTEFIIPAELPDTTTRDIQATTRAAHLAVGCQGVSRIDFLAEASGAFAILEVNTIPGMTDVSDLPAQAQAMGISYDALVDCLLQTAAHRCP
ncbi:MAG: D-alanine--D-alanine ligase [Candidatus Melainabacteria bacterium]|nr:D-alanine--D-alanine ligase [Candidatus Melainabacteria bacterium]